MQDMDSNCVKAIAETYNNGNILQFISNTGINNPEESGVNSEIIMHEKWWEYYYFEL